jgi:hypothetical protein
MLPRVPSGSVEMQRQELASSSRVANAQASTTGASSAPLLTAASGASICNLPSRFSNLTHSSWGFDSYKNQFKNHTRGMKRKIEAHHLIEKRFVRQFGGNTDDWSSVVLTRPEHAEFTKAWRAEIPLGFGTTQASRAQIEQAARKIYADYPEILTELGL